MIDLESKICGTTVTIGRVKQFMLESAGFQPDSGEVHLKKWEAEKIGVGQGFMSHIIKVKFEWDESVSEKLPSTVVLKIPTAEELVGLLSTEKEATDAEAAGREWNAIVIPQLHACECAAYRLLQNTKIPVPLMYHAKEIGVKKAGILALEDLSGRGVLAEFAFGLSVDQLKSVLSAVAQLHAWSFKNSGSWEGKFPNEPRSAFKIFLSSLEKNLDGVTAKYPKLFPAADFNKIRKFYEVETMLKLLKSHEKFNIPPVMVHGDLWCNNIMFKPQESKDRKQVAGSQLAALLDWQAARPGFFAEDLVRLILLNCHADLRKKEEQNFLEFYHEELCKASAPQRPPFDLELVRKAYRYMLPATAVLYCGGILMVTGDQSPYLKDIPNDERQKAAENLLNSCRVALDDTILSVDEFHGD